MQRLILSAENKYDYPMWQMGNLVFKFYFHWIPTLQKNLQVYGKQKNRLRSSFSTAN